jgi:hypothetical protein
MKRCPTCNRTYEDDALSFCLTDGSVLVKDEPGAGAYDPTPVAAPPPAPDWSTPPTPAVPSSQSWSPVGLPPQSPSPNWGANYPTPPGGYAIQKKEQGLAIGSLVCGILSFLCCSVFTGIPAIVLGIMAISKEKNDPGRYGGKGMAIGGIVLGAVSILILGVYGILVIAGAIPVN